MQTRIDEIAPSIYRMSIHVNEFAPGGFTFNHFLVDADQPLLYHCGARNMFPALSAAAAKLIPLKRLRWISFGHVEGDECGSMNQWLAAAPESEVAHGALGCDLSINDFADRAPRSLDDGEVMDLGGKRVRFIATPHVPHTWEAGTMFEETTGTLLCGDLFAHFGDDVLTTDDIVAPAIEAQQAFMGTAVTTLTGPTLRRLADLNPRTLALMHGASFNGNCAAALQSFADYFDGELHVAAKESKAH